MKDTNVNNEVNTTLSKFTKEQLQELKGFFKWRSVEVDGFYPTLNLELVTKCMKQVNENNKGKFSVDLTGDEFVSIIKEYGCVSHSFSVSGNVDVIASFEDEKYEIPAEKIEELGVDEIQSWDEFDGFDNIAEIVGVDSWDESSRLAEENWSVEGYAETTKIKVITTVKVVIPTQEKVVA